jgi:rhodanese-related sulfurtransferase
VNIDRDGVIRLVSRAALVEVLPEAEYAEAHLAGAINIPIKEMTADALGALDRERPVIVYCQDWL